MGAVEAIQAQGCLLLELSKEIHIIAHPLENLRGDLTLRSRASCPHLDHGSFAGIFVYLQTDDRAFLWTGRSGGGCEECGRFVSPSGGMCSLKEIAMLSIKAGVSKSQEH